MILFFSATGNTYDAARIIAEVTGDRLIDLGKCYKHGEFELEVSQGEDLGIVFPVYRWSTPRIVDEFIRKMSFKTDDGEPYRPDYCYAVDVYGYFTGAEVGYLEDLLQRECGIKVDASFEVPSVANCIYVTNSPSPARQAKQIRNEENAARRVAQRIKNKERNKLARGNPIGRLLSKATGTEEKPRPVKQFSVNTAECIGCGTCASVCPTNTVTIIGKHPVWQGDDCTECLACVHRCPEEAVEYGKISRGRRRYVNPILSEGGKK